MQPLGRRRDEAFTLEDRRNEISQNTEVLRPISWLNGNGDVFDGRRFEKFP